MVKIRLARTGAKKDPKYRIVITEEHAKRNGRFIEAIGYYDPMRQPLRFEIDLKRYYHWIGLGAQPTKAVTDLLKRYEKVSQISG